jgi:ATP synthase F1 delta subunit
MLTQVDKNAKKYALAYTSLYFSELNDNSIQNFLNLANFLKNNSSFYAYLSIPHLAFGEKQNFVTKLSEAFKLTQNQYHLASLLLKNKKIEMLGPVLQKIVTEYNNRKGIIKLKVYTSHDVNDIQKRIISEFIKSKLKINAIIDFLINKNLVCGIKIKSENLLWEKSVVKYLRDIKKNGILQVEL